MANLDWFYILAIIAVVGMVLVGITRTLTDFVSRERRAQRAFELDKLKVDRKLGNEVES